MDIGSTARVADDAHSGGTRRGNPHPLAGKTVTIAEPGPNIFDGETTVSYEGEQWYVRTSDLALETSAADDPKDASAIVALIAACEDAFSVGDADEDEDVATPPIGITFGMIMRARMDVTNLETYITALERRIAQQRIQLREHQALQHGLGNKTVRKRVVHLEGALGRMTLKYDRQKLATEALAEKLRAKTEECAALSARHLQGEAPEDREIILYDLHGEVVHKIGAHFATPGCKSLLANVEAISRIEIKGVGDDEPLTEGDRVRVIAAQSVHHGRTGIIVPKHLLHEPSYWDVAVTFGDDVVRGFKRRSLEISRWK